MSDLAKTLQMRIAASGPGGEPLSLLAGGEPVAELRNMILCLVQACPANQNHLHCPFRIMSGLSYHAMCHLIKNLPYESCLNLFELELKCRSQAETPCFLADNPPPA